MKKYFKIIIDVIMLIMMVTLFNKSLISMRYHEVAGIILIALVCLHIVVNIKIAKAMCVKFIKVPVTLKIGLIVDIFLLLSFSLLGISGILISRTILTGILSHNMFFKLSHMFCSALSVILLGVHIGLHIYRKPMPVMVALITSLAVFAGGIYGAVNSNVGRWLSMPFVATMQQGRDGKYIEHKNEDHSHNAESKVNKYGNQEKANESRETFKPQNENRQDLPRGNFKGGSKKAMTPFQKMKNIIMFLGMILSCTMITYWIAILTKKKKTVADSAKMS